MKVRSRNFIDIFKNADRIDEFDEELFLKLVERIEILDGRAIVWLLDGVFVEV